MVFAAPAAWPVLPDRNSEMRLPERFHNLIRLAVVLWEKLRATVRGFAFVAVRLVAADRYGTVV